MVLSMSRDVPPSPNEREYLQSHSNVR
ncbi:hypothetical protein A2U01_0053792, partial [Trifolium medium]|nr:hypothetical protein [Trifolium medium]